MIAPAQGTFGQPNLFYAQGAMGAWPSQGDPTGPSSLSPDQITTATNTYWYDASDIDTLWQDSARTTPVTADADPVGAWDDLSGNSRHVLQATAANRPTYKTSILNGMPVVRGDGTNDALDHTTFENDLPVYVAAVVIPRHATNAGVFHDRSTTNNRLGILADTGDGWRQLAVNAGTHRGTCTNGTAVAIAGAFATGASNFLRIDGVEYAAEDLLADNNGAGVRLFAIGNGGASGQCDICELAGFNAIPSAAERAALETYLTNKWLVAPDVPVISYAGSPFTENIGVAMSGGAVTNTGGASTNFAVVSGSLPPGITLNATTGELTGTPV